MSRRVRCEWPLAGVVGQTKHKGRRGLRYGDRWKRLERHKGSGDEWWAGMMDGTR